MCGGDGLGRRGARFRGGSTFGFKLGCFPSLLVCHLQALQPDEAPPPEQPSRDEGDHAGPPDHRRPGDVLLVQPETNAHDEPEKTSGDHHKLHTVCGTVGCLADDLPRGTMAPETVGNRFIAPPAIAGLPDQRSPP